MCTSSTEGRGCGYLTALHVVLFIIANPKLEAFTLYSFRCVAVLLKLIHMCPFFSLSCMVGLGNNATPSKQTGTISTPVPLLPAPCLSLVSFFY